MAMTPDEIIEAKSRLYGGIDHGILQPDEQIFVIVVGPSQQAVVGTDRRVFVYKSGNKAGAMMRRKVTSWDYADVANVELVALEKSGSIIVHPAGPDPRVDAYGAAGHASAQQSPNAISLASRPGSAVEDRVAVLNALVAEAHAWQTQPDAESPARLADEIRQLGALRDEGALTEEEFQAKKAQLLERF